MPSKEFIVEVRLRLGLTFFPGSPQSLLCPCGAVLDKFSDHLLGCDQKANLFVKQHDSLCDVIFSTLLVDDSRCRREQRCNSTSDMRPGDIFNPNFQHGLPTYFDVTVRNPLQPAYLVRAASHAGAAAEAGEMEKDAPHDTFVTSTGSKFEPLVVECFGLWSPHSLRTLKIIARKSSFHSHRTISQSVSNLHQQLSVKLWLYITLD